MRTSVLWRRENCAAAIWHDASWGRRTDRRLAGIRGSYSGSGCEVESGRIAAVIVRLCVHFHACWNRCAPHLMVLLKAALAVGQRIAQLSLHVKMTFAVISRKVIGLPKSKLLRRQAQSLITFQIFFHFVSPFFVFLNRLISIKVFTLEIMYLCGFYGVIILSKLKEFLKERF